METAIDLDIMETPVLDRMEAAMNSPRGKFRKCFKVQVIFDHAENPQVIVNGTYSAAKAIDAARDWAMTVDRHAAVRYFGMRKACTVIRTRKGEQVEVHVPAAKNPTARERLMASALNGGSFSVSIPDKGFTIKGTFVGYVPVA
jgi:hypothetical protein